MPRFLLGPNLKLLDNALSRAMIVLAGSVQQASEQPRLAIGVVFWAQGAKADTSSETPSGDGSALVLISLLRRMLERDR